MKFLKRLFHPVHWTDLRVTQPISKIFGMDRGTPVDRYYIEKFLTENKRFISGRVLEVSENTYTNRYSSNTECSLIFDYSAENKRADLVGDLSSKDTLTENYVDCFICTQTFNFIYDFKKAIEGSYYLLKPGGILLVTLAGLCQISKYDMDRWGDFWRFTSKSAETVFAEVFGKENITVSTYGNVLSAVALLHGIAVEELKTSELDVVDENYQIVITVIAKKC